MNNKPKEISMPEWKEIMSLEYVKEGWSLADNASPEEFASMVYGSKFDFVSGGPGFVGDLYIVQGDSLEPPVVIVRRNGSLQVADHS